MLSALVASFLVSGFAWDEPAAMAKITDPRVNESSGLAASPTQNGVFYTHNDSGDSARFFRFDKSGRITGEFKLKDVKAVDWEDMASAKIGGKSYLYFADIGDNNRKRDDLVIHRVEEPKGDGGEIKKVDSFRIEYPDKKRDCEAFMVDPKSGDFWLVTKARDGETVAYKLEKPDQGKKNMLKHVAKLEVNTGGLGGTWVTGGDISPDGQAVVIRTYSGALEYKVPKKFSDWVKAKPLPVKTASEAQGEAICYSRDSGMLLTSTEGSPCVVSASKRKK